jgi:hypothetical protein
VKAAIIYSSKTGNTDRVAHAMFRGLGGCADMFKLEFSHDGMLERYIPEFTFDLSPYDLVFLGGWVMVMRVHPFTAAYIKRARGLEGRAVAGFITGGSPLSRAHVRDDFAALICGTGATLSGFYYASTLLGPLLTRRKLALAEVFARELAARL